MPFAVFIAAFGAVSQASSTPQSKHLAAHDKTMSTLITWPEMPHMWDAKTKAAPNHPTDNAFETVKEQTAKWVPVKFVLVHHMHEYWPNAFIPLYKIALAENIII